MQWIPSSVNEWSVLDAESEEAARWVAVGGRRIIEMKRIACSVGQCIQVECSGIHAACCNGSRLNAVDSLQHCVIDTNVMQWIPCIEIQCSGFHAAL